uniref:non-specific serine/threonine protein kinase n=1 Tax=Triticum urartu TaxID=4572 RepID=A0A8R7RE02_TRIUA
MLITEIGNLVLFDNKNATMWQSFNHPTDTLVLGQSLLEGMRLTASTSATNTTENQLYITVGPDGLYAYAESTRPQLYYYSSWVPNDKKGNGSMNVTFMNGSLSIFVHPNKYFLQISLQVAESTTQCLRLDPDGHMRLYEWSNVVLVHDIMALDDCDYPTICGEYGICTEGEGACPVENNSGSSYFKPVDDRKLNLGCTPMIPISCEEIQHHRLFTLADISYFDNNCTVVNAINEDDCKQACLKNCSCRAVMFSYYDQLGHGLCIWMTKIFSFRSLQQAELDATTFSNNSFAYLKVQVSPSNSNKKKVMLGAALGAIATLVLLVILVALYLQRKRKYEYKDDETDFGQLPGMPTRFSLEQLGECTEGFGKKLGEGGFGSVFEGKLGEERVAVKRLEGARQGKK